MSALTQQTPEWLEMRRTKIGASDAPIILGVSPWKTPYILWEEKVGFRNDNFKSFSMQRGLDLEEKARQCFEKKTNIMMFPRVVIHPKNNWMMASLDGMDIEEKNILEIKCVNKQDHETAKSGKIPEKYIPQLQHQMEVTGFNMTYYFSFDGEDGVIVEYERNNEYISNMIMEEKKFYDCMTNFIPPKHSEKDFYLRNDDIWINCV